LGLTDGRRPALRFAALAVLAWPLMAAGGHESPDRVARGRYLATAICECLECHSPLEAGGREIPVATKLGAGDILDAKQRQVAPNITPDLETGAGGWTDAQLVRAIREGISHDNRRLSQAMPYPYFSVLTDEDVGAIVAYLRSLPPVHNPLPKWIPPDAGEMPPEPLRPAATSAEIASPRARGGYLVRLGRCGRCHSPRPLTGTKRQRRLDMEFGGGRRFSTRPYFDELDPDPVLSGPPAGAKAASLDALASPNITADPSGIGWYDESMFIQTIRSGRVGGVRALSGCMPWLAYRKLTDDDLAAIFEYLRSVPRVKHRVSNADPPTWCPRCGRLHGLGELNTSYREGSNGDGQ
jgi:mono/diheme cytochrome c family protein